MGIETALIRSPKAKSSEFVNVDAIYTTQYKLHAISIAQNVCMQGAKMIIVAAGDGIINETINGIARANCLDRVILGIQRNGSGNDLARSLGIRRDRDSRPALIGMKIALIDLGRATYLNPKGELETRIFDNFAGVGFDAEVAKTVEKHKQAKN
jgi:diacylglycerol kinase family enzyme